MHEQAIAKSIIRQAESYGRIKSLSVECGELAHLPANDLQKALKSLGKFEVKVSEMPAVVKCGCGHVGRPKIELHSHDATIYFCSKCGSVPEIMSGKDIMIKRIVTE
jgi:Zn finger protein HypA/HybF involved in hydrogenase expression